MTFAELDRILKDTGRKGYAFSMLACLFDAHDRGEVLVEKGRVVTKIEITDTNVAAVARRLEEFGVIEILYWDNKAEFPDFSKLPNGRWSTPFYKLTPDVLELFRRRKNAEAR